jgi:hypothetical protein
MADDPYPDDVECPDWCVGNAKTEPNLGAHFTGAIVVDGLSDGQAVEAFGVRGWYDGESDYVELAVRGIDGRTTRLQLDPEEWRVVSTTIDQLMYQVT